MLLVFRKHSSKNLIQSEQEKMTYFCNPKTLEKLAFKNLCKQFKKSCLRLRRRLKSSSIKFIQTLIQETVTLYYNGMLPEFRSKVIQEVNESLKITSTNSKNDAAVLFLLGMLLDIDMKYLKIHMTDCSGCEIQNFLFKLLASKGVRLKSLDIRFIRRDRGETDNQGPFGSINYKLLRTALSNMKDLEYLRFIYIVDNTILQLIGTSCPKLIYLDISDSINVNDKGLKQLMLDTTDKPQYKRWVIRKNKVYVETTDKKNKLVQYYNHRNPLCNTLKVLNLNNTDVSCTGIVSTLTYIPQLESFGRYKLMGNIVKLVDEAVERKEFKFPSNLTELKLCRDIPQLEKLTILCPNVQKLWTANIQFLPKIIESFRHITSLKIYDTPMTQEELNLFYIYIYEEYGKILRVLHLKITESEDSLLRIDLREIFNHCPNLHTLLIDGFFVQWTSIPDSRTHKCLTRIQLGRISESSVVILVLMLAPLLKIFHIYKCTNITHKYLRHVKGNISRHLGLSESLRDSSQNLKCIHIAHHSTGNCIDTTNLLLSLATLESVKMIGSTRVLCYLLDEDDFQPFLWRFGTYVKLTPPEHFENSDCFRNDHDGSPY